MLRLHRQRINGLPFVLILIVVVFIGIPLAITLATPARYLLFYLLWLAMLGAFTLLWPSGADHSAPFGGTGEALTLTYLGILASIVILKLCIVLVRLHYGPPCETEAQSDKPEGFALVLAGITGLLAAPWSMFVLAILLSERSPAVLAHGSVLLVPMVAGALGHRSRESGNTLIQTFADALTASAIIALVAGAMFIGSRITFVVNSAESSASENPYCIQIAAPRSGYRAAATRLDLSPLMMRARCDQGWCFANHGILAVGGEGGRWLTHWSYRFHEFRGDVYGNPPVVCQPRRGFARHLPLF